MIVKTPPMGWNTWNTFGVNIDEKLIKESADALVETGLAECGYTYLVMDDGWSEHRRDENSRRIVPDHIKFPNGIVPIADYIHSKGLKLGMYSCCGYQTCAAYPSSYEHEFIDAETFAEWGVDYLKYDYCYKPNHEQGQLLYRRMGTALANCGRDIVFSGCSWGADNTHEWIKTTGAHLWRSTGDIFDTWDSIKTLTKAQMPLFPYNGNGCFNDMDKMVVGMRGKGNVGFAGCTDVEYRTHFSIWALCGSPLMIGCDIRDMSPEIAAILKNKEVIAIDQDPAYGQVFRVTGDEDRFVWARLLANGDYAIGMVNLSDTPWRASFALSDMGINGTCQRKLAMKELWSGEETASLEGYFMTDIAPHDCKLYRAKVVKI